MAPSTSTKNSLFYDLLVLSRFTKYNPVFTTFAGGMDHVSPFARWLPRYADEG